MAFRFRKSFRIAPGIKLNLSRSGLSTTLGGRGLSVNTGRRDTYVNAGIPGIGVSSRSRLGGSRGSRVAGAGGAANPAASGCGGCGGCGGLALMVLVFAGFCGSLIGGSGGGSGNPALLSTDTTSTYVSTRNARETLYTHGRMNIRSGGGTEFAVVRTVSRGERVEVGPEDHGGWAPVYERHGEPEGYVYRASRNLRTYAPPPPTMRRTRTERRARTYPSGASAVCRDGTYSYSARRRGTCSHHGGVAQWL